MNNEAITSYKHLYARATNSPIKSTVDYHWCELQIKFTASLKWFVFITKVQGHQTNNTSSSYFVQNMFCVFNLYNLITVYLQVTCQSTWLQHEALISVVNLIFFFMISTKCNPHLAL